VQVASSGSRETVSSNEGALLDSGGGDGGGSGTRLRVRGLLLPLPRLAGGGDMKPLPRLAGGSSLMPLPRLAGGGGGGGCCVMSVARRPSGMQVRLNFARWIHYWELVNMEPKLLLKLLSVTP
jgi:hypothetical protein